MSLANVLLDGDGGIQHWDAPAQRLFGFTREGAVGRHCSLLYHDGAATITALLAEAAEVYCADFQGACVRHDGSTFPGRTLVTALPRDGKLRGYSLVVHDLAEQSLALGRVRELHRAQLYAGEAERTRIAHALRDEVGDRLTASRMDLARLAGRVPADNGQLTEITDKMAQLADATIAAVRRIATDLRPAELDTLGMVPAMETLVRELSERTGIAARFDAGLNGAELRGPLATALYRMLQEALEYVAIRTRATAVHVILKRDSERLLIAVRGNGSATDVDGSVFVESYGALSIKARAQALGGAAEIGSPEGGGTLLEITIPPQ